MEFDARVSGELRSQDAGNLGSQDRAIGFTGADYRRPSNDGCDFPSRRRRGPLLCVKPRAERLHHAALDRLVPGQQYQPYCGLLWWLMFDDISYIVDDDQLNAFQDKVSASGEADTNLITHARLVKGHYDGYTYYRALNKAFTTKELSNPLLMYLPKQMPGKIVGWFAQGYLGQYLLVIPGANIVVVRMIESRDHKSDADDFPDFEQLVPKLLAPPAPQK